MTKFERFRKQFAIEELEKIKAKVDEEIKESVREAPCSEMEYRSGLYKIIDIIDNRISELKGENNDTTN